LALLLLDRIVFRMKVVPQHAFVTPPALFPVVIVLLAIVAFTIVSVK
jgi:hypothetical protein